MEFQKKRVADLDREEEEWREPIREKIKTDLEKLKKKVDEKVIFYKDI